MTKSTGSLPNRLRKKLTKEIREGMHREETKASLLPPDPILSAHDIKKRMTLSTKGDRLKKEMINKKKKLSQKHAKRSGPGFADGEGSSQNSRVEGKRWVKTLIKQTENKNKIFTRKSSKLK